MGAPWLLDAFTSVNNRATDMIDGSDDDQLRRKVWLNCLVYAPSFGSLLWLESWSIITDEASVRNVGTSVEWKA